jgi:2-polyprenyl-6-methoxyphenol hydroxylase-like FAD-dependent oxidoreductase
MRGILGIRKFKKLAKGVMVVETEGMRYKILMSYRIWAVHRADLQQVLFEAAVKRGISLRLGCPVVEVDDENLAVVIKGGERIEADVIVGADGKSAPRKRQWFRCAGIAVCITFES